MLSRRRYAQILAGASVAGIAGCLGGGDDEESDDSGGNETGDGEVQRTFIRVHLNNVPEQSDLNPWTADPENDGETYLTELTGPTEITTNDSLLDGHTWEATWFDEEDEISIPTMYTDYELEPPFDITEYFNEDLTYWDGTPLDAVAKEMEDFIYHADDGNLFIDDATFNRDVIDQWTLHRWYNKGEVEGQEEDPRNPLFLEAEAAGSHAAPPHPDFMEPYYERFHDAGSQDEADDVSDDLSSDNIPFSRLAENDWGSGLYQLDPNEIGQDVMRAYKRDDHPNEHATVEEIEFQLADSDRFRALISEGMIDIDEDIVQEKDGQVNREVLPDHMQEIERYVQDRGDIWLMNWNNEHLKNLWVRRAIVAAIDWNAVSANGWGPESSIPSEYHVGMTDGLAERTFSFDPDFLDQMYTYPIEKDLDTARDWLGRAGYEEDGGDWYSPDGEELRLTIDANTNIIDWSGAYMTAQHNLQELGINIDYQPLGEVTWQQRFHADSTNYTMSVKWTPNPEPWDIYSSSGDWWAQSLAGGDPESENPASVDHTDYSEMDNHGRPFEQEIPTELGSIEAPDQAGRKPTLEDSEVVSIPQATNTIIDGRASQEEVEEALKLCARYANFYLPNFTFHSYTFGYWGNVRDFRWPERGHPANYVWKEFNSLDYTILSGCVQTKYDDEFPDPNE